jgi:hypothetical protein
MNQSGVHGWLVVAGFALAALGFARGQNQDPKKPQTPAQPQVLPVPSVANADSNGHMIAVTGTDITGASILYLVDTRSYQLAVYQATGGTDSTQGVKFVGARRIDLDMQLFGFNDRSEWSYKELREKFEAGGLLTPEENKQ